ncbi:TadE/TadG family type IV pilus assembly protein, partial [Thauera sp. AutoDN2]|uniref:TadE/TadG family type IV pilus assembly protein n=1 Tax=Thauera sp. AutoDN2 TaxID=3416051 RepID=UPI003F4B6532
MIEASTAKLIHPRRVTNTPSSQRGATLVELVIAGPLVLFILLVLMQYALLFHARSQLNYATF